VTLDVGFKIQHSIQNSKSKIRAIKNPVRIDSPDSNNTSSTVTFIVGWPTFSAATFDQAENRNVMYRLTFSPKISSDENPGQSKPQPLVAMSARRQFSVTTRIPQKASISTIALHSSVRLARKKQIQITT